MTLIINAAQPHEDLARLGLPRRTEAYVAAKAQARERDYLRRWVGAEQVKTAMRRRYAEALRQVRGESREDFLTRSRAFWAEYEHVNRQYIPDDPVYSGVRAGATLATTADLWTLTSPASGQVRIVEHMIGGESTASTVLRFAVQISTGGATPTNQTPEKFNTRSPAAASSFRTAWTTAPTLSGNPLVMHAFNTFGGFDRWAPPPGGEVYLVNGEQLSGRSASGTPVVSSHLIWEEL